MEEDFFHLLIAPRRSLSLTGARILADQGLTITVRFTASGLAVGFPADR
jgi:hypothetical protein